jgi:hypothetical protein
MASTTIDWVIMAVYFAFVLGIGAALKRYMKTSADYFLAGRSIPALVCGLPFISANLGAQEVIGMGASGARYGLSTSHFYWIGTIPAMVFVGTLMMPFYYCSRALPGRNGRSFSVTLTVPNSKKCPQQPAAERHLGIFSIVGTSTSFSITDSTPTLLRNVVKNGNHWLTLKLIGGPKSQRDAVDAKVFLTAGGVRQRADIVSGGSCGSSSDPRVHFVFGTATMVDKIEIHWPSGARQTLTVPGIDRILTVEEGKAAFEKNSL